MRKLIPACLALAALSLLLPSVPTYDPWSWIVWGREVAHLDLDTTGGPSWKPLPVMFTSVFSVAGAIHDSIPPLLWLMVARAGALLALALVFRLARRLAGPGWQGVGAGVVAAVALAFTPQWLRYGAHGNEAPLALAAMLWAIERHLDGSRRAAVALGVVACLMRPEVFPFLVLYCAWAWRAEPATRRVIAAGAVILPVLWLIPEWIGWVSRCGRRRRPAASPAGACRAWITRGWSCSHGRMRRSARHWRPAWRPRWCWPGAPAIAPCWRLAVWPSPGWRWWR